jgi:hypothetical protein
LRFREGGGKIKKGLNKTRGKGKIFTVDERKTRRHTNVWYAIAASCCYMSFYFSLKASYYV